MTEQSDLARIGLADALAECLRDRGSQVFQPESPSFPELVVVDPSAGLICINTATDEPDQLVRLNRGIQAVRDAVPDVARVPATRRLLGSALSSSGNCLSPEEARSSAWIDDLPARPLAGSVTEALIAYFSPRVVLELPTRFAISDSGAEARATERLKLDFDQTRAALTPVDDVLIVNGPPGSGKTLVLVTRARMLARHHPDWTIQFLCYNRVLVPYIERLVSGFRNISVLTIGRFSSSLGVRMDLTDEHRAAKDFARAKHFMQPGIDAILIDEWQDFLPAWTSLALASLRPGRGGAVFAGDPKQALYRDTEQMSSLTDRSVARIDLPRPYRSTRQILEVTSALSKALQVDGRESAMEGEPVDLVWAQNAAAQAEAVARDAQMLLQSGGRQPEEIAVLVTRKWDMGRVLSRLLENKIPARIVYPNTAAELDLNEPTIKIMTVHSAKGLEFDVVFLIGLEHLPDPDGTPNNDRQGKTGYVGATRARDQLVMTYSKDNAYLEHIRTLPVETLQPWVWPDDYPEI